MNHSVNLFNLTTEYRLQSYRGGLILIDTLDGYFGREMDTLWGLNGSFNLLILLLVGPKLLQMSIIYLLSELYCKESVRKEEKHQYNR